MLNIIAEYMEEWFENLVKKVSENPVNNGLALLIALVFIVIFGKMIFQSYGIITFVGYLFACFDGITKVIDNPKRAVVWAVGFIIGAVAFKILIENFIPAIKGTNIAVSVIGGIVILYVVLELYMKAKELKNA